MYGLGNAGARTLKEQGLPIGPTDWRARNRSYTRENLDHTLAVASFMVDLELSCWARPDVSLIPFEEIVAGAPEATRASPLPMRWAVPLDWLGYKADVHLIPDAIFGLKVERSGEPVRRSYVFLEVDRGTMTIAPTERVRRSDAFLYRATILRKFLAYAQSYREGLHRRQFGIPAARILFLTTSQPPPTRCDGPPRGSSYRRKGFRRAVLVWRTQWGRQLGHLGHLRWFGTVDLLDFVSGPFRAALQSRRAYRQDLYLEPSSP